MFKKDEFFCVSEPSQSKSTFHFTFTLRSELFNFQAEGARDDCLGCLSLPSFLGSQDGQGLCAPPPPCWVLVQVLETQAHILLLHSLIIVGEAQPCHLTWWPTVMRECGSHHPDVLWGPQRPLWPSEKASGSARRTLFQFSQKWKHLLAHPEAIPWLREATHSLCGSQKSSWTQPKSADIV